MLQLWSQENLPLKKLAIFIAKNFKKNYFHYWNEFKKKKTIQHSIAKPEKVLQYQKLVLGFAMGKLQAGVEEGPFYRKNEQDNFQLSWGTISMDGHTS